MEELNEVTRAVGSEKIKEALEELLAQGFTQVPADCFQRQENATLELRDED